MVPFRMGNSHPSLFPYEPLPTADGELVVAAGNDAQFGRLCEVLGCRDWPVIPVSPRIRGGRPTASSCARCWPSSSPGVRPASGSAR